jgi:hypothetical protein
VYARFVVRNVTPWQYSTHRSSTSNRQVGGSPRSKHRVVPELVHCGDSRSLSVPPWRCQLHLSAMERPILLPIASLDWASSQHEGQNLLSHLHAKRIGAFGSDLLCFLSARLAATSSHRSMIIPAVSVLPSPGRPWNRKTKPFPFPLMTSSIYIALLACDSRREDIRSFFRCGIARSSNALWLYSTSRISFTSRNGTGKHMLWTML